MMTHEWAMEEEVVGIWAFGKKEGVEIGMSLSEQMLGEKQVADGQGQDETIRWVEG